MTLASSQRQVHFRRAGEGPPVVVLHASPGSSAGTVPLIEALAGRGRTVFAPDTPGFGESDPLLETAPSAGDFARALSKALSQLGLERFDLYGAHTGAKIALELAVASPERVRSLVLDGLALYTAEEARRQLECYTVSLAPQWDGSHVVRAWQFRRDMSLFWPWYDKTPANRRLLDMPDPERLHAQVVDMLRGAGTYQLGYAAAFSHPTREVLPRLAVPTSIVFRESDVLGAHVGRFPALLSPVRIDTIPRAGELQQLIERVMTVGGAASFGSTPAVRQAAQRRLGLTRDYVQTSHGQMHVRRGGPVTGTPLLMLHDAPGSSLGVHSLAERLAERRPVLAPDLTGCGDSDPPDWPRPDESLAPYADALAEVLDGVVDVYGEGAGAALALELSTRHPQQVRSVFVRRLPALEPRDELVEPRWDGAHLVTTWNMARNHFLFAPWYRQTADAILRLPVDTEAVHSLFMDILRSGRGWCWLAQAAFRHPMAARLAALNGVTEIGAEGDSFEALTQ